MEPELAELKRHLAQVYDLNAASAILAWDQETYMPPGGSLGRAQQLGTLQRLSHEKFTSDEVGRLLEELSEYERTLPYDSDDASLVRITRREFNRRIRVPAEFVARQIETGSLSYQTWVGARPNSDFAAVEPWLERNLELSREYSSYFPESAHVADPLIDAPDPGMTAASVRQIFAELRAQLMPLVNAITSQTPADDACLHQRFSEADQLSFSLGVAQKLGYDLLRGRQDKTAHPFAITFSLGDVRITTRVRENYLAQCLFSTIHESGHAMYEQGIDQALARTPLATGTSAGVHESQSRLWENLVGRSRGFWQYFYPQLQACFPAQLGRISLDTFYRAINKVDRSLIRVEADEVTYNLHVMMRFDFELQMLEGKLAIRDLPDAWDEVMARDLGITPPDHASGVMQDVHWFFGPIGGTFQGYTLGNIMSAQFFESAIRAHPEIPDEIAAGEFRTLHGWLTENIYRHGSKFEAPELVQRATGGPISIEPYIRYLRNKYGELYEL